ncbi:hypothetical protein [Prevotella sp. 10(H)]|uniref:hypothetical protein n=1 Tax=Prevotella sp. 10(H) TaxID=1158294 RepID=UPI0004A735FE|nr:hypothetical protein [Prevotella sp. 10(H)]
MELTQLENIWQEYDKKLSENTRLNKEILKKMLTDKPEKRLNRMKLKANFSLFSPAILLVIVLISGIQFQTGINFYIGLALFLVVYIMTYVWDVRYFSMLRKISLSDIILITKRKLAELEKYRIRTTRIRYILMPPAIVGVFLMLFQIPVFSTRLITMFVLMFLVYILSIYYCFRYTIYEEFKRLKAEIEEIESIEKNSE